MKRLRAAMALNFGDKVLFADRTAKFIAKGSVDREEIVMADVDWSRVNEQRTHWPFLRDRRVDAYGEINRRLID